MQNDKLPRIFTFSNLMKYCYQVHVKIIPYFHFSKYRFDCLFEHEWQVTTWHMFLLLIEVKIYLLGVIEEYGNIGICGGEHQHANRQVSFTVLFQIVNWPVADPGFSKWGGALFCHKWGGAHPVFR